MKRKLTGDELETVICFNRAEEKCVIDTADCTVIRKLDRLCEKYPVEAPLC